MDTSQIPEWLGAGLLTAALAALGYVVKQIVEGFVSWEREHNRLKEERRTRLIALQSILRASKSVFDTQVDLRNALYADLVANGLGTFPQQSGHAAGAILQQSGYRADTETEGYEAQFSASHENFTDDQRELHALIRAYTIDGLYPLNQSALEWLQTETYYKSFAHQGDALGKLARHLSQLEAHLILWRAKYKLWIPDKPSHALVYLGDEKEHGIGFPKGIEQQIDDILRKDQ